MLGYAKFFLGLYHAGGRMILALELSVDGVVYGLRSNCKKNYPK